MTTEISNLRALRGKSSRLRSLIAGIVLFAGMLTGFAMPAHAADAPTVTAVTPSGGPVDGGQVVVIKGTSFTGATAVKFGTVSATSFGVMTDKSIVAVVPDAVAAGDQLITVTTADGTNATGKSYKYGGPTVTAVSPAWAKTTASSIVTVTGSGFTGAVAADVKIGGKIAVAVWVISDKSMVVKTPIAASGDVVEGVTDVIVTRNSVASATGKSTFLFASGPPTITGLTDGASAVVGTDGVAVGEELTVTGTQLLGVTQVNFGKTKVTSSGITIVSATKLTVTLPKAADGPIDVVLTSAAGSSITNLKTPFNYYSTKAPVVTSLYPGVLPKAAGGTFLVYGKGFTGLVKADITIKCATDLTPASVLAVSDTALIVVAPANASDAAGTCDLEIANPVDALLVGTLADAVRYT